MSEIKTPKPKQRAPTLYVIIALKLLKGLFLLLLAFGVYGLSDTNLPDEFLRLLDFLRIDPEKKFFSDLMRQIATITPANLIWLASGTFLYSFFSLIEGTGLLFRVSWAGWMAIGESSFFIPIEIYELMRKFSPTVFVILLLNIFMVWYLLQNRARLFRHH